MQAYAVATHLISQAKYKDPCTPRGFTRIAESVKLPVSVLEPKVEYRPFAHAVGNFSECRSAALTLLQKGNGSHLHLYLIESYHYVYFSSAMLPFSLISISVCSSLGGRMGLGPLTTRSTINRLCYRKKTLYDFWDILHSVQG